jgi:uncharacterized protein (TIGR00730 family)
MQRIGVFCGARHGAQPAYAEAAAEFGKLVARAGCGLVYGAGRVGLMGIVAQACLDHGGHVTGVIPGFLNSRELLHPDIQACHTTETLFERKAKMMDIADAFAVLPGGIGTYDELLEVMAWRQLGQLAKPIALLDTAGYFGPWIAALEHASAEGFVDRFEIDRLCVDPRPARVLAHLLGTHGASA